MSPALSDDWGVQVDLATSLRMVSTTPSGQDVVLPAVVLNLFFAKKSTLN